MRSNSLIKDNIFDLSFSFAVVGPQLVNKKEVKLKFKILVFDKF